MGRGLLSLLLVALLGLGVAVAGDPPPDDVDPLALAALMIRDGHWDRAEAVLDGVDPSTDEDLDRARFYTLVGMVHLRSGRHQAAADALQLALDHGQADPLVRVQLAQALEAAGDPAGALAALDAAGETADSLTGTWLLRARAHEALGDLEATWGALQAGRDRFPEELELERQQVLLLIDLGLYQEAVERGTAYAQRAEDGVEASLALAEALRRGGQGDQAAVMLEGVKLTDPTAVEVVVRLAGVYLELGMPHAAGSLLQTTSVARPDLAVEAAECFRQAGELDRALALNAQVPDPVEKARQRLGLFLEQESWTRALALESRLSRLDLLSDEAVRYGVAYAAYQELDFDDAEALLSGIADPQVFKSATQLREAMSRCVADPRECPS